MDRERFDALARRVGASGSRRAVLGGLVGAAALSGGLIADTDARNRRRRRRRQNAVVVCFGSATCEFRSGGGQDLDECAFINSTIMQGGNCGGCSLRQADLRGANLDGTQLGGASLREANLRGTSLIGADLRGAVLRGACLTDANLTNALTDGGSLKSTQLAGTYLCRTTLPDGQVANDNCGQLADCCSS